MKLSPQEKAEHRAAFRQMTPAKKLDHIITYYKIPIFLILCGLFVLGEVSYRQLTKREPLLYGAYMNVTVGEELDQALTDGFVSYAGEDPKKSQVEVYRELYLSADPDTQNHQYAYASRMKLLATIQAQEIDLALMNQEAYDLLSGEGYLAPLPDILEGELAARLEPLLTENTVILEDNSIELALNEADAYEAVTEQSLNALRVNELPLFQNAGFTGPVYLGVIGNSPRLPQVFQYMNYLLSA